MSYRHCHRGRLCHRQHRRRHSSRNFDPLGEIPESFMSYRHCHRGRLCHRHHRRRHSSRNFDPLGEIPGMVI